MKVPSIGTCSSSVPFDVSNLNPERLICVHIILTHVQVHLLGNSATADAFEG